VRFELDCTADRDRRLKGTLGWEDGSPVPFSGTLELLRLIEDHTARRPATDGARHRRRAMTGEMGSRPFGEPGRTTLPVPSGARICRGPPIRHRDHRGPRREWPVCHADPVLIAPRQAAGRGKRCRVLRLIGNPLGEPDEHHHLPTGIRAEPRRTHSCGSGQPPPGVSRSSARYSASSLTTVERGITP